MPKPSEDLLQPKWIDINDFEFLCFNLARELLEFSEPIPDYSKSNLDLLESSLAAPKNSFELSNSSLIEQASVLFYSLIKNHPYENGNKRIAVMTLLVFSHLNKKWVEMKPSILYKIAILVAESKPEERDFVLKEITTVPEAFVVDK